MKLILYGACGRMGREVTRLAAEQQDVQLVAAVEHAGHPLLGTDAGSAAAVRPLGVEITADAQAALEAGDVVLDFSTIPGSAALIEALGRAPRPAVVAVTGFTPELGELWSKLSSRAPVLLASNLSLGAAVLRLLAARAARALVEFDVEVTEIHHRAKADAPSGTALDIVAQIAGARGLDPGAAVVHGRRPGEGPRLAGSIGVHAVRGGSVAGEHEVLLLGEQERLSLHHSAESRVIFARGALKAAAWIAGRDPGLYSMDEVASASLGP